jgi:capsular exopolysaccharide synthesis family protein
MSRFFQALEQADRDRTQREEAAGAHAPAPTGVVSAPPTEPGEARMPPVTRPAAASPPADRSEAPVRPPVTGLGRRGVDPHLVSLLEPGSLVAEPYRALRHLVEQRRRLTDGGVLLVTSPGAGDGKTTTAINLAGALAQDPNARILLIEADLRSPALASRLGLPYAGQGGLVDAILDAQIRLEAVVQPCPPYNLDVLPAGQQPRVPYELLASPRLAELVEEARRRYDHVLVDSPPLVPFPDGRILAGVVDGCLLVVSASRTPRKLVEEALALVDPAKFVGLVFNGEERPLGSYYGHSPVRDRGAAPSANGKGRRGQSWLAGLRTGRRGRGRS